MISPSCLNDINVMTDRRRINKKKCKVLGRSRFEQVCIVELYVYMNFQIPFPTAGISLDCQFQLNCRRDPYLLSFFTSISQASSSNFILLLLKAV